MSPFPLLFHSVLVVLSPSLTRLADIVDIKPANMEELTEVITAASFHPLKCNEFVYSSSKGTIRLCDMREKALCDDHAKCEWGYTSLIPRPSPLYEPSLVPREL